MSAKAHTCRLLVLAMLAPVVSPALAGAGDHILWKNNIIAPYLTQELAYDSDVRVAEDDEEDDISSRTRAGILLNRKTDDTYLVANLWLMHEMYSELDEEDHTDWGQALTLRFGDVDELNFTLSEALAQKQELDYPTASLQEHYVGTARAALVLPIARHHELGADVSYRVTDYEREQFADWYEVGAGVHYDHLLTPKTAWRIQGEYALQSSDSYEDDMGQAYLHTGASMRMTDKTTSYIGVGVMTADTEDSITEPSYVASINWQATDVLGVTLTGNRRVEPDVENREIAYIADQADLSVALALSDTVTLSAGAGFRYLDYESTGNAMAAIGELDRTDEELTVRSRLSYTSRAKWLTAFIGVSQVTRTSDVATYEYDQLQATAGATVTY